MTVLRKNVGMVVAIEIDAVLAKYGIPAEKRKKSGYEVLIYANTNYTLYVVQSGAGEIASAAATQYLISEYDVEVIVNFGVVGALSESMKTADVCIVEQVVHYDFEGNGWLGTPRGVYPGKIAPWFETSRNLIQAAKRIHLGLPGAVCASADKFVSDPEKRRALRQEFGADICEMEAAGIVITCKRNNIPCLLIKSVSDSLTGGDKEFHKELERASEKAMSIMDCIIRMMPL
ncbi:MAG: 5'-methylthioadenosine/S-adenosylhomocysteine nucleosidase [Desulfovibrionaceae bacterium]|nr:5'-methylthioadenosine/S-adenosylhomocysteine nucleosidase [Desulfovibrionaceae bacterium]